MGLKCRVLRATQALAAPPVLPRIAAEPIHQVGWGQRRVAPRHRGRGGCALNNSRRYTGSAGDKQHGCAGRPHAFRQTVKYAKYRLQLALDIHVSWPP